MNEEKRILFGTDGSDFSMKALSKMGDLLKNNKHLKITIFHAASDIDFSSYSEVICQSSDAEEKFQELQVLEAEKVLKKASDSLIQAGFDQAMISTVLENKCNDPSGFMLNMAHQEKIDTIAVARWGKSTVSYKVLGSTPYRLSQTTDNRTLWVVDHRISSSDVLIGIVGASVSQRVVDYTVEYFSHLKDSKFTLFHVIPSVPPQFWEHEGTIDLEEGHEMQQKIVMWMKEYTDKVKEIAEDAKNKLVNAGVPERNVVFRTMPTKKGIARDIFLELERGKHGILVLGRRGFRDDKDFALGSKANKLLIKCRGYIVCLIN